MENDENWAKAENPEVQDGVDAYKEAQQEEALRQQITVRAYGAVKYGHVDRDWANAWLVRLGAQPVTGQAQYRINVPVTGNYGTTVTAGSRAEALEKFNQYVAQVAAAGKFTGSYGGIYGIELTGAAPTFFSGPQDPTEYAGSVPGLEGLKSGIRQMLKQAVTEQGWGHSYAVQALDQMGLEPLPTLHNKTVQVPVSGLTVLTVPVFADDDDEAVQAAVTGALTRAQSVSIKPDEVGSVMSTRPDAMGLNLVDEEHAQDDLF
jgi:hypothetical protein